MASPPPLKFIYSFGGRHTDVAGSRRYVGGDTFLISLPRPATLPDLQSQISRHVAPPFNIRYRFPDADTDELISVTTEEDFENMIQELDGLQTGRRLRMFIDTGQDQVNLGFPKVDALVPESVPESKPIQNDSVVDLNPNVDPAVLQSEYVPPVRQSFHRRDDCQMCLKALPHSHSDPLIGGNKDTGSALLSHSSEDPMLFQAANRRMCGVEAQTEVSDHATVLQQQGTDLLQVPQRDATGDLIDVDAANVGISTTNTTNQIHMPNGNENQVQTKMQDTQSGVFAPSTMGLLNDTLLSSGIPANVEPLQFPHMQQLPMTVNFEDREAPKQVLRPEVPSCSVGTMNGKMEGLRVSTSEHMDFCDQQRQPITLNVVSPRSVMPISLPVVDNNHTLRSAIGYYAIFVGNAFAQVEMVPSSVNVKPEQQQAPVLCNNQFFAPQFGVYALYHGNVFVEYRTGPINHLPPLFTNLAGAFQLPNLSHGPASICSQELRVKQKVTNGMPMSFGAIDPVHDKDINSMINKTFAMEGKVEVSRSRLMDPSSGLPSGNNPTQHPTSSSSVPTGNIPSQHPTSSSFVPSRNIPSQHPTASSSVPSGNIPSQHPTAISSVPSRNIPSQHPASSSSVQSGDIPTQHPNSSITFPSGNILTQLPTSSSPTKHTKELFKPSGNIQTQHPTSSSPTKHTKELFKPIPLDSQFSHQDPAQNHGSIQTMPSTPNKISRKEFNVQLNLDCQQYCKGMSVVENSSFHQPQTSVNKDHCLAPLQFQEGGENSMQESEPRAKQVETLLLESCVPTAPVPFSHERMDYVPQSKDEIEHVERNESLQSAVSLAGYITEDIKTEHFDKLNLGVPLTDNVERLQIIRNIDIEELQELGSRSYGTVYHGKWKGSDVAIKRIHNRFFAGKPSEEERMRNDFRMETCKLAELHHPNVVAFYGVVLDGPEGSYATITEFMVNGSLRLALQKNNRLLDKRNRLIIAKDIAFGMEYLHDKKIVHSDLKSDNLLVNLKDPQRPICKVSEISHSKGKRQTVLSCGVRETLPWMAPELLSPNASPFSEKVDVFSFGIVMWELLTGKEPYANMPYADIIGGIMSNTLRPTVPEDCEPEWRFLMESCWSSDPSQRPSFTEIATRLRSMS